MKPLDIVFWIRVLLGFTAGILSGVLGFLGPSPEAYRGILVAVALYSISYYLVRYGIKVNIPPDQVKKLFTTGLSSFIMMFLFTWILYNTLSGPIIP
ncbi:MAG: hypothetical protein HYU39_04290 [Thaumarchaeota archaeon]|nr:hypothetical protein [Nitrososphaerota archaeon]